MTHYLALSVPGMLAMIATYVLQHAIACLPCHLLMYALLHSNCQGWPCPIAQRGAWAPGHRPTVSSAAADGPVGTKVDKCRSCIRSHAATKNLYTEVRANSAYMAAVLPAPATGDFCSQTAQSLFNEYDEALQIESSLLQRQVRVCS